MTDEIPFFITNWLKNLRSKDVPHSMNMVTCDISLNKCMPKSIKEVENQLQVNRRFFQERKNLETQAEIKIKKASRIELRRNQRKQKRYEQDLKDADENLKYFE